MSEDKQRRKTLSIFRSSSKNGSGQDMGKFEVVRKHDKPPAIDTSGFVPEQAPSPQVDSAVSEKSQRSANVDSPRPRPRTLQKTPSNRNSTIFGSLRSLRSLEDEEKNLTKTESQESMFEVGGTMNVRDLFGYQVLHFGEVQTAGSVFKKRSQYLVLTETHLIRFRSQTKACEAFPTLPAPLQRSNTTRRPEGSVGSFNEMHGDITFGIALDKLIAAYKLDDGKPYFTVEVSHLDEQFKRANSMQVQLNEPQEADLWLTAIRAAARKLQQKLELRPDPSSLEHVAQVLQRDHDYDPAHLQIFPVVQRASHRASGRSSTEDLSKLNSTICYFVIGLNKIHLVPLPKISGRSSTTSLSELDSPISFGLVTLSSVFVQVEEHSFQLIFRTPGRGPFAMHLASSNAGDIVLGIRNASMYLRPEWTVLPFVFNVPLELDDSMDPPNFPADDYGSFDRTLVAYCVAYGVDVSRICYSIDEDCEDAPCFKLAPATDPPYNALEILAVLRALRYNESFKSLSFANIKLNALRYMYDPFGYDIDSMSTRSGKPTKIEAHESMSVLCQEIRALALKSRRLRRMDFTSSISKPSSNSVSTEQDPSCGIPEAIVPLCKKSLTNVDWVVLNGIRLIDADLDYLVDAASCRACHLRALEIGDSELSVHDMDVLLSTMATHEDTLEVIDISGSLGRFSAELFQQQIGYFGHIRRLNLTRVQKTAGPEPLIPPEVLLTWRLEQLFLSQTAINEQTVDSISAYLASPKSDLLRELHLDQCGLSGKDLAVFFQSMTRERGEPRWMHISASENRLRIGYDHLFKTIEQSYGPTHLTARMIEFEKEHHFRQLVQALSGNTTLKSLDISKASLPYDATLETCEALKNMFAVNTSLEELDISGDHAHLDSIRFGIGLNLSLTGLKNNKTLKILRIEHQDLGLQGASTLAEVLEENDSLLEVYCENNFITLQSLTILVNALAKNRTLMHMSTMEKDRRYAMVKVKDEVQAMQEYPNPTSPKVGSIKRTFTGRMSNISIGRSHRRQGSGKTHTYDHYAPQLKYNHRDIQVALRALNDKWDAEIARQQAYLRRNYHLAHGLPLSEEEMEPSTAERPDTAESISALLEKVKMDRTPTMEKEVQLGADFTDEPDDMDEKELMVENEKLIETGRRGGPMFTLPGDE